MILLNRILGQRTAVIAIVVAILIAAFTMLQPSFLSFANVRSILLDMTILTTLAVAQVLVVVTRNFDLSVGATVGLSAMTVGILMQDYGALHPVQVFALAVAVGMLVGLINAALIIWLEIPSIILTLGMISVLRGATFLVAHGAQVNTEDVPDSVTSLGVHGPFGIPMLVYFTAVVVVIIAFVAHHTRLGRNLNALGSNPHAARLRGLPVRALTVFVFVLSGAAAGLGGAYYLSRFGFVQIGSGIGLEMTVVAAVVVGGASVFGGSGSVWGTVLGCLLLAMIGNALAVLGVSQYWQGLVFGSLILLAVIADAVLARRAVRQSARKGEAS